MLVPLEQPGRAGGWALCLCIVTVTQGSLFTSVFGFTLATLARVCVLGDISA